MKHSLKITLILLFVFLIAQFVGIAILYNYIDTSLSAESGETVFKELPIIERPEIQEETSYIPVILAIIIGTVVLLFLMKHKLTWVWKIWFLFAVVIALSIAFGAFLPTYFAVALAIVLGIWKIFKPQIYVHTFTELFVYGGLAAIFVPIFNLFSVSVLMVLIALYDAYAVWKSKHMVTLAKAQTDSKVFAGLLIPYKLIKKSKKMSKIAGAAKKTTKSISKKVSVRTAVLGGGDIGFPLIFAGVIMKELGLWQALIIPLFAAAGLGLLLWKADEKKFYPAMPFIGAACFLGLGVVWLIGLI